MIRGVSRQLRTIALIAMGGCLPSIGWALGTDDARPSEARGDVTSVIWSLLLPHKVETTPNLDRISAAIAELGINAIQPATAILFGDEQEPALTHAIHPSVIDKRQDILVKALRSWPKAEVVAAVRARADVDPNPSRTLFAVRTVGRIGGAEAVRAIETMASTLDEMQWTRPFVLSVFEDSLGVLAKEDPRNLRRLGDALMRAPARAAPVFARTIGLTQRPAAVPMLLRAVGRARELDMTILVELDKIGDRGDTGGSRVEIGKLRSFCESTDSGLRRCAALALARLGDEDSCGPIIALLDGKHPATIAAAEKSLTLLTGVALGRDSKAWTHWREREQEWFETYHQRLLEELASNDSKRIAEAVREWAGHRLFRHQAALAVTPLLLVPDAEIQRQARTALGLFGSARALPALLEHLESTDETGRNETQATLKRLTGLDLPPETGAWRNAILPSG